MLVVSGVIAAILLSLAAMIVALRSLEVEVALLRARTAKLVRLSVAVDDLQHETTQVVPAYRSAMTRARTLRRTGDFEGGR